MYVVFCGCDGCTLNELVPNDGFVTLRKEFNIIEKRHKQILIL